MTSARGTRRMISRLLALALFLLTGLGLGPRLKPVSAGCQAGSHACCCAPAGQAGCACAGHKGAAAQFASLIACDGGEDVPGRELARTPGVPPHEASLLCTLLLIDSAPETSFVTPRALRPEPLLPPPRFPFLSREA